MFQPAWLQRSKPLPPASSPASQSFRPFGRPSSFASALPNPSKSPPMSKGTIVTVKDNFGFIRLEGTRETVFYHRNETDQVGPFREGDEVEFVLERDERASGKEVKATRVRLSSDEQFSLLSSPTESVSQEDDLRKTFGDKKYTLEWINDMLQRDSDNLLLHLSELTALLDQDELPFSIVPHLITLLTRPALRQSDRSEKIYSTVLNSKFLRYTSFLIRNNS